MRVLVATDAWHPQVNGVVRTLTSLARAAKGLGVEVEYEDTYWYDTSGQAYKVWLWDDAPAACSLAVLKNGKRYPAVLTFARLFEMLSSAVCCASIPVAAE